MNDTKNEYKLISKEYDLYNKNDINDDFEIIESPNNDIISDKNKSNNENTNYNKKLNDFIVLIFKIIFDSRNQGSLFLSNNRNKSNNKKNNSFQIDFEELIEYENLRIINEDNDKKKYFIDFYLIKNDNNENDKDKKSKLLVERWKIKYKENIKNQNNIKNFELFLNKKLKIIEKSIVTYSRVLPLFNLVKKENYSINFQFCPKDKDKFIENNKSTKKIKLINDNVFSFKLSIKYLKIKTENIDRFIKKNSFSRRSFSNYFKEKKSNQLLENCEDIVKIKPTYRLSFDKNYNVEKYINSKFNEPQKVEKNDSDSNCESVENLDLDIKEVENSNNSNNIYKSPNDIKSQSLINTEKTNDINNVTSTKENTPKKCQTFQANLNNEKDKKEEILHNSEIKNEVIKSIVNNYKNIKKMLLKMPKYGDINYNKLATFISNN